MENPAAQPTGQLSAKPAAQPLRSKPIFTPYVLGWTICGTFAAGYLTTMFLVPDLLEDLSPSHATIADPQSNQGKRAAAKFAADIADLRAGVTQVQLELSKVKTEIAGHGERERALNAQLAALEQKIRLREQNALETAQPVPPQADLQPPQQKEAAVPQVEIPAETKADVPGAAVINLPGHGQVRIQSPQPAAPATPKLINANATAAPVQPAIATADAGAQMAAAAAQTAPAAAEPPAFTTSVIKPPKPLGVHLSTGASVDSLRLSWSLLADRHGDALENLEARYIASGDDANPNFDLIAGPIKSKSEAQKVCKALAAKNVPCKIGDFGGEAL